MDQTFFIETTLRGSLTSKLQVKADHCPDKRLSVGFPWLLRGICYSMSATQCLRDLPPFITLKAGKLFLIIRESKVLVQKWWHQWILAFQGTAWRGSLAQLLTFIQTGLYVLQPSQEDSHHSLLKISRGWYIWRAWNDACLFSLRI